MRLVQRSSAMKSLKTTLLLQSMAQGWLTVWVAAAAHVHAAHVRVGVSTGARIATTSEHFTCWNTPGWES